MKSQDVYRRSSALSRRGSVLIITAGAALLIIGMLAVGVDLGWVMYQRAKNQTAVNAGWKAGFDLMALRLREVPGDITDANHAAARTEITERVKIVMAANGYTAEELSAASIKFLSPNRLEVEGQRDVEVFFGNVIASGPAKVASHRGNTAGESFSSIIPLAIPHGVVKDLSKNTYNVDFFGPSDGFTIDKEYVLKLGSGDIADPATPKMILVHMGLSDQTDLGFKRAYGLVYWCLADPRNPADSGFAPCYWLLGYDGGSFFLPYKEAVLAACTKFGVNYEIIEGQANIDAIFDEVPTGYLIELKKRPLVSVFSSQPAPDPVEVVLRDAWIPYGTYNPARADDYVAGSNTKLTDSDILDGDLDDYNWIHLHHEDFTGFGCGCLWYQKTCKEYMVAGGFGSNYNNNATTRATARSKMCPYCNGKYSSTGSSWSSYYTPTGYSPTTASGTGFNCTNYMRRCADRTTFNGTTYPNDASISNLTCYFDSDRPLCRDWTNLYTTATTLGFNDDTGSYPKPQRKVDGTTNVISLTDNDFFIKRSRVQKMKQAVAQKVKEHLQLGGFMFAMCFAAESFELSLFQKAIAEGKTAANSYLDTIAFTGFNYYEFPYNHNHTLHYSTINDADTTSTGWTLGGKTVGGKNVDARCQNHKTTGDTGAGYMGSMNKSRFKTETDNDTILGAKTSDATKIRYLKGVVGTGDSQGQFAFLGGHFFGASYNQYDEMGAIRCVLNNVLLGALSTKPVVTDVPTAQKNNHGIIDPDNTSGGPADDYQNRLSYGFSSPLDMGYRILPDSGNQATATDLGVTFRLNGTEISSASKLVIIPITDIPPEVPVNNTLNATAQSIYDLNGTDNPSGTYIPPFNFGASVRIVGFAEFELLDPDEYTRAGTNVVSGDNGDLGLYMTGQVRGKFIRYIVKPGDPPAPY